MNTLSPAVCIRARPLDQRERSFETFHRSLRVRGQSVAPGGGGVSRVATSNNLGALRVEQQGTITLLNVSKRNEKHTFTVDDVFLSSQQPSGGTSSFASSALLAEGQALIYDRFCAPLLQRVVEGHHIVLAAYGSTGTGKTFSLFGTPSAPGVVPRACNDLFQFIAKHKAARTGSFFLELSIFEVYNESIRDLLNPATLDKAFKVRQHKWLGVAIEGLSSVQVASDVELKKFVEEAMALRSVGTTNQNAHSSRSHAVVSITLKAAAASSDGDPKAAAASSSSSSNSALHGKILFIDCAGSEALMSASSIAARSSNNNSANAETSTMINKSLTHFSKCIAQLSVSAQSAGGGASSSSQISYKDSQLTFLLHAVFQGVARLAVIGTVSPSTMAFRETLATMQLCESVHDIKISAALFVPQRDPQVKLIAALKGEIATIKASLKDVEDRASKGGSGGGGASKGASGKTELLQKLVETTELFQEATEGYTERQAKQKVFLQQRVKGFAKLNTGKRVPVNNAVPRLHLLNDVSEFPDVPVVIYLQEGDNVAGTKDGTCSIRLTNPKATATNSNSSGGGGGESVIQPVHAVFSIDSLSKTLYLSLPLSAISPKQQPEVFVNGQQLASPSPDSAGAEKRKLQHLDRVFLGSVAFRVALPTPWTIEASSAAKGRNNAATTTTTGGGGATVSAFSRNPKTAEHMLLLEEHDRIQIEIDRFVSVSDIVGEAEALKTMPEIYDFYAQSASVEARLVLNYPTRPLNEHGEEEDNEDEQPPATAASRLGGAKKRAAGGGAAFDLKAAVAEKQQQQSVVAVDAKKKEVDSLLDDILSGNWDADNADLSSSPQPAPLATAASVTKPRSRTNTLSGVGAQWGADDDDDDIAQYMTTAINNTSSKNVTNSEARLSEAAAVAGGGGDGDDWCLDATTSGEDAAQGQQQQQQQEHGEEHGEEDEFAVGVSKNSTLQEQNAPTSEEFPKLVASTDATAAATSLRTLLQQELQKYDVEVTKAKSWKQRGPTAAAAPALEDDCAEYRRLLNEKVTLAELRHDFSTQRNNGNAAAVGKKSAAQEENDFAMQGLVYKLRVKKTVFHRGGFFPVEAKIKGRFLYYFDRLKPSSSAAAASASKGKNRDETVDPTAPALGGCYLYGAAIEKVAVGEWRHCLRIEPTAARKVNKSSERASEDNDLILGFETEQDRVDWLKRLRVATRPEVSVVLKKYFDNGASEEIFADASSSSVAASTAGRSRLLRAPTSLAPGGVEVCAPLSNSEARVLQQLRDTNTKLARADDQKVLVVPELLLTDEGSVDSGDNQRTRLASVYEREMQRTAQQIIDQEEDTSPLLNEDGTLANDGADSGTNRSKSVSPQLQIDPKEKARSTIMLRDVHRAEYLKRYFRTTPAATAAAAASTSPAVQQGRMWLVDHFRGTIECIDLATKKAAVFRSTELLSLSRSFSDPTELTLTFFYRQKRQYVECFVSFDERERFFQTATLSRKTIRCYCPALLPQQIRQQSMFTGNAGGVEDNDDQRTTVAARPRSNSKAASMTDCNTRIDGTGNESLQLQVASSSSQPAQMTLTGECIVSVSSTISEQLSVWCGTFNLSGFPLQSREAFSSWLQQHTSASSPLSHFDILAITVQEASYRRHISQFFDFVESLFGEAYCKVADCALADLLLIVLVKKHHTFKIANVQTAALPSHVSRLHKERGGVAISFFVMNTPYCFVAVHLPREPSAQDLRVFMLDQLLATLVANPSASSGNATAAASTVGDARCDPAAFFEYIFLFGDFGFPMSDAATMSELQTATEKGTHAALASFAARFDTLTALKKKSLCGGLSSGFTEAPIEFPPTYCVEVGSEKYNVKKWQTPSYDSRVFVACRSASLAALSSSSSKSEQQAGLLCLTYKSANSDTVDTSSQQVSDHIAVAGSFVTRALRPVISCFMPLHQQDVNAKLNEGRSLLLHSVSAAYTTSARQEILHKIPDFKVLLPQLYISSSPWLFEPTMTSRRFTSSQGDQQLLFAANNSPFLAKVFTQHHDFLFLGKSVLLLSLLLVHGDDSEEDEGEEHDAAMSDDGERKRKPQAKKKKPLSSSSSSALLGTAVIALPKEPVSSKAPIAVTAPVMRFGRVIASLTVTLSFE